MLRLKIVLFLILVIIFLLFFYRLPIQRVMKNNEDIVYSPAYGKIMEIKQEDNKIFMAIFLSPLDVHYQFAPISGKITNIKYDNNGMFNLAFDLNKSKMNEKAIYTINNKNGDFIIYQIAGFLVRRVQTLVELGQYIDSGENIGLIHFGSRVDLIIPNADKFTLKVNKGDTVSGSYTIIGTY